MGRSIHIEMQVGLAPSKNQEETWLSMREEFCPTASFEEDWKEGLEVTLEPPHRSKHHDEGTIQWCDPKGEYDSGDEFWHSDELAWRGPWGGYCLQSTIAYEDGATWTELEARKESLLATANRLAEKYSLTVGEVSILAIYF